MSGRAARASAVVLLLGAGFASSLAVAHAGSGTTTTGTTAAAPTTTVSTAPAVLVFTGHGWGHGIGMSQWGASGYAQHGFTYDRILAHYYPGTALSSARGRTLRVLVAQSQTVTVGSTGAWSVTDATGARVALDPGTLDLGASLALASNPELQPPFAFTSPQPLTVGGRAYRGKLVVSSDGKAVSVVDTVGLEQYLRGVVPAEMPSTWPPEALKAQAVAARSYALANLVRSKPFDLYGDTRSQVYGGVAAESGATDAAVDATAGEVLTYDGKVADTLFHSSSGGRTVSALEATGVAVPYLVSVADPYDTLSPYHDWGPVLVDATKVAKTLKLATAIDGLRVTDGPAGRVTSVQLTGADDTSASFTGNQLRLALGLRSTWFQPVLLRLGQSRHALTYGGAVTLLGSAAGATAPSLEAKPTGAANWSPAGALTPDADGSFSLLARPRVTTYYRLADGLVRAGMVRVAVAARVGAALTASGVAGTAKPATAGTGVELQERQAVGWASVSSTVAGVDGSFAFRGALAAGTYRVRVSPGHGVAPGVSAPLAVP